MWPVRPWTGIDHFHGGNTLISRFPTGHQQNTFLLLQEGGLKSCDAFHGRGGLGPAQSSIKDAAGLRLGALEPGFGGGERPGVGLGSAQPAGEEVCPFGFI